MWSAFAQTIEKVTLEHVPVLLPKPKGKPWMNRELIREIRKRDRIFRRNKKYPTSDNLQEETEINRKIKNMISKAKSDFLEGHITSELNEGNTKPLFHLINKSRGQANQINCLTGVANEQIADKLAEFLSSVYAENSAVIPPCEASVVGSSMENIRIGDEGLRKLLLSLDQRKA